ncbi:hypothetical protein MASR2M78_27260 [Treponema sp.]
MKKSKQNYYEEHKTNSLTNAEIANSLIHTLKIQKLRLALAESCTAGLVSAGLASISGASEALWGSYICYTLDAKQRMLAIDSHLLETFGPVSKECARSLAENALRLSGADLALSVTGWAGPGGGDRNNPVGTVWIGTASASGVDARRFYFPGDRDSVRQAATGAAWEEALRRLSLM